MTESDDKKKKRTKNDKEVERDRERMIKKKWQT
jgi:hypothetical protein